MNWIDGEKKKKNSNLRAWDANVTSKLWQVQKRKQINQPKKKKKKFAGVFCVSMAHNVDFTWE